MRNLLIFITLFICTSELIEAAKVDSVKFGNFGKVYLYHPKTMPEAIVLFVSGNGGWESGAIDMASQLAAQGALVVGIDIRHYMGALKKQKNACYYPAGDFESLSLYLQKKFRFPNYLKPILVGYSSGATLVYGILAQAPANTFKGAISLEFCRDFKSDKPLCSGKGLKMHVVKAGKIWDFDPCDNLTAPFIVIKGSDDKVCSYDDIKSFLQQVNNSELISLPKVGHDFEVQKTWLPQLLLAYNKVKKSVSYTETVSAKNQLPLLQKPEKLSTNLPLIVLPALKNETMPLLVLLSGDGGWTSFDEGVSESLVKKGIPVIGIDSQKYFWQARTPDETVAELIKVLHHYLAAWNKKSFVLCGYSFGADVIPFMVTRLPGDLKNIMKSAVMMSPDPKADFEIHVADMLSFGSSSDKYNVLAELNKSSGTHVMCIFGENEDSETPALFRKSGASIRLLPGSHHYNNDLDAVANEIVNSLQTK